MPSGKRLGASTAGFETVFLVTTIIFALITIVLVVSNVLFA